MESSGATQLEEDEPKPAWYRTYLKGAGNPMITEQSNTSLQEQLRVNPFHPFNTADEFTLARWFVEHQISSTAVNSWPTFSFLPNVPFNNARQLKALADKIEPTLGRSSWKTGKVYFDEELTPSTFLYRNPLCIIEYLLQQPAYRSHLNYAPYQEFNDEQRIYNELHTADWWWETQVSVSSHSLFVANLA